MIPRPSPLLLAIGIILIACMVSAGCTQAASSPRTDAGARQDSPPADVSDRLQNLSEMAIREAGIPGMQIEVSTPHWTWNNAFGNASPVTGEPAQPGMRFLIASVSKTFTSVAVQKLAEEGRLSLDDPIDRWLEPGLVARIPNGHAITIRQLLDHTSGIADYNETAINLRELSDPDTPVPYQAGLTMGLQDSPLYPPGTNYTYSNVNYILLTLIVDKAAGVPYEDYATRKILVPAGLNETFFQHTNHIPGPHMRATMPAGDGSFMDFTDCYVLFDRGAGDIVSTAADLNRFHRALREGKIINRSSLARMEIPTPQSGKAGYGLGYATERISPSNVTVQGHTGGYPGSFTFWYYLPEEDTYVTWNLNGMGTSQTGVADIRRTIITALQ
ncbi:MAG: serine hydrolase domain-containing protein [Methanoregula sp.]